MSHACTRLTDRLRLEPIDARLAGDLFALYQDAGVARWYGRWTRAQIEQEVARIARSWLVDGVHKWMAYQRVTGECVGRGGLSRTRVEGRERLELVGRCTENFGAVGTPLRSGGRVWSSPSASWAPRRSPPSPKCTTTVLGRLWSGSDSSTARTSPSATSLSRYISSRARPTVHQQQEEEEEEEEVYDRALFSARARSWRDTL